MDSVCPRLFHPNQNISLNFPHSYAYDDHIVLISVGAAIHGGLNQTLCSTLSKAKSRTLNAEMFRNNFHHSLQKHLQDRLSALWSNEFETISLAV